MVKTDFNTNSLGLERNHKKRQAEFEDLTRKLAEKELEFETRLGCPGLTRGPSEPHVAR